MSWPQLVFGWPPIILSLALFALAFSRERSTLGFWALPVIVPFLLYASSAPGGLWYASGMLTMLVATAWLLHRGRRGWAAACVAPFALWIATIAVYVATQR